jgi:hypothetical protein
LNGASTGRRNDFKGKAGAATALDDFGDAHRRPFPQMTM